MKRASHRGSRSNFYYWRDKTGHEIDLLVENGQEVLPLEIKV
jgi:predicted AAA+ superfamily ATPase